MDLKTNIYSKSSDCRDSITLTDKASKFGFSWLDSTLEVDGKGQNSFLFSDPIADIYLLNGVLNKKFIKDIKSDSTHTNIFDCIEQLVQKHDLCAVGYISYESMLKNFGIFKEKAEILPSIRFLLYENYQQFSNDSIIVNSNNYNNEFNKSIIKNAISEYDYIKKVQEIKRYIKEGDIYQANFTTRFKISSPLSPIDSYLKLRELNPSPYGSYLNFGNYQILSSSPERMFTKDGDFISSCPIKGTIALGNNELEQKANLRELLNSHKDKAELLMIVDLMRNDLGKIAQTGTVEVNSIYKPEIYSSLMHLVSDISATLKADITFSDIVDALIPGGSITGAPKKRAIEIINKLESHPRFVYTGSIGYMTKEKTDFNIAIRTMYHYDNHYYIHAGGGIVADSDPLDEYNEMLLKAKNLFQAVGIKHV